MKVTNVVIVGGTDAIGAGVEGLLKRRGFACAGSRRRPLRGRSQLTAEAAGVGLAGAAWA